MKKKILLFLKDNFKNCNSKLIHAQFYNTNKIKNKMELKIFLKSSMSASGLAL